MAKDPDDDLPALGEGTVKFLEDAKTGKPRSFLLVCKGAKVQYLSVRKKPVKKNEVGEAKKLGYKGDAYFGVITGKGAELTFNLPRSEYDTEPVKDKALKDFLDEHAQLKVKPTILLVDLLPAIPFDEEDLKHPLIARFVNMEALISRALDARPDAAQDLAGRVAAIRNLLQDAAFNAAEPQINQLESLLQELLGGQSGSSNNPLQLIEKWQAEADLLRNNQLAEPTLEQALALAREHATQGDLTAAEQLCGGIAKQFQELWKSKLAILLPRVKTALSAPFTEQAGDVDKLRSVLSFAQGRAKEERFGGALVALSKVAGLLDAAADPNTSKASDVIQTGHVAAMVQRFEKARQAWDAGAKAVAADLKKVQDSIREVDAAFADALSSIVDGYRAELMEFLDAAKSAGEEAVPQLKTQVIEKSRSLRQEIANDELLAFLETFPEATLNLQQRFEQALVDVENHLSA